MSTPVRLINATQIAALAGVGLSAVSNWKRRSPDFPVEVAEGLYAEEDVVAWLRRSGREIKARTPEPVASMLWRAADELRAEVMPEDLPEIVLQLLALRAAATGEIPQLTAVMSAWSRVVRASPEERLAPLLREVAADAGRDSRELGNALDPSGAAYRVRGKGLAALVAAVDSLPDDTAWGDMATAVLTYSISRLGPGAGEYTSHPGLASIMTGLVEPITGRVYDPACGMGSLLLDAWSSRSDDRVRLFGQEINARAWRIAYLRFVLHGLNFELAHADTLKDDRYWELRADRITAQPPLGQYVGSLEAGKGDPRWQWGLPPRSAGDLAWVQHVAFHLAQSGVGVVAVGPGALFRGRGEAAIRSGLVESDLVDAVIQLPSGLLAGASVAIALIVLQKGRGSRSGRVLFIDASRIGRPERGGLRRIDPEDVATITSLMGQWRTEGDPAVPRVAAVATAAQIASNDANLTPARYVSYTATEPEIDGEPVAARLTRLTEQLDRHLNELPDVATSIERVLKALGGHR